MYKQISTFKELRAQCWGVRRGPKLTSKYSACQGKDPGLVGVKIDHLSLLELYEWNGVTFLKALAN